jgi:hypothetical protein
MAKPARSWIFYRGVDVFYWGAEIFYAEEAKWNPGCLYEQEARITAGRAVLYIQANKAAGHGRSNIIFITKAARRSRSTIFGFGLQKNYNS